MPACQLAAAAAPTAERIGGHLSSVHCAFSKVRGRSRSRRRHHSTARAPHKHSRSGAARGLQRQRLVCTALRRPGSSAAFLCPLAWHSRREAAFLRPGAHPRAEDVGSTRPRADGDACTADARRVRERDLVMGPWMLAELSKRRQSRRQPRRIRPHCRALAFISPHSRQSRRVLASHARHGREMSSLHAAWRRIGAEVSVLTCGESPRERHAATLRCAAMLQR